MKKKAVSLHRKTNNNKKIKNINALLKYGLNLLAAIVLVCLAVFDCVKGSYGQMVIDLSIVFFNCFALLFTQNAEKIDAQKEIEKELKQ